MRNEDLVDLLYAVAADLSDVGDRIRRLPRDGVEGIDLAYLEADDVAGVGDEFSDEVRRCVHAILDAINA